MNPPTVIFRNVGKKQNLIFLKKKLFYPPTLNIICFVEKNNVFFEVLSVYF